jgi:hypothetical protein
VKQPHVNEVTAFFLTQIKHEIFCIKMIKHSHASSVSVNFVAEPQLILS